MRAFFALSTIFVSQFLLAQSTYFPLGHPVYLILDREDIKSDNNFNTKFKPYSRRKVCDFLKGDNAYLNQEYTEYSLDSTKSTNPFLKRFYRYKADFYRHQDPDLHVNPVIQFSVGRTNDGTGTLFVNSRGIEIRGTIDKKIAFYTNLTENQARYPGYVNAVRDSTLTIPYEGFWKQFNGSGVDFLRTFGYIDFGISKHISAQLGYGKHFVGNGVRSLVLSDFSNNYPYLRISTKTKLFEYTNLFTEMIADVRGGTFGTLGTGRFSKKYVALHHLNINIKPNLIIGLFESVTYGDSVGGLKLEYLNPIIFYRAVEQQNGSEDNAFIGMDFKWNIKNRISLYGQLLIDELVAGNVFSGNGWWGNKQGFQLGVKYTDPLHVENLSVQGELNRVRPYTYAHSDGFTNYSHYNQALAHPLGANFTEYLGQVTYQLNEQWRVEASGLVASYGNDLGSENFGRDILKSFLVRRVDATGTNIDFGNEHLQGNKTNLLMGLFRVVYMWKHNVFINADFTFRKEKDSNDLIDTSSTIFGLSFRWNVTDKQYLF